MGRFDGRHLAVIGATAPIGAAIAAVLAEEGARLTLVGRDAGRLETLRALSSAVLRCDLSDPAARAALPEQVTQGHGRIDGLVYVAGYHRLMPLGAGHAASLAEHLLLNTQVPFELVRLFASRRFSDDARQRSFTLVASIAHRIGEPALSAYSASKAALVGGMRALAVELAPRQIRINTVSPGWIAGATADGVAARLPAERLAAIGAAYPLGLGSAEDVAAAVAFLASDGARWVTGTDLVVDGGRTCV